MLAKRVDALPEGEGWVFEPKWDGFRVLVFRDGDELVLQSRDGKPLERYFPEVRAALLAALPPRCALDGELVIARAGALDFEALQLRLHPAASRIEKLARELPASIVLWDALCVGDEDLRELPFAARRARLVELLGEVKAPVHLTPSTTERATALDWFQRFEGAGFDGVMAKQIDGVYEANKRVMLKVKHARECDCVVAGFRWHKRGAGEVGSLLLGLYDAAGQLQHVGVVASFTTQKRKELVSLLAPYRDNALEDHPWKEWAGLQPDEGGDGAPAPASEAMSEAATEVASAAASGAEAALEATAAGETSDEQAAAAAPKKKAAAPRKRAGKLPDVEGEKRVPGAKSRWSAEKDLSWVPVRPELVVEVGYDHMQGTRFRHTAQFRRWRPDKPPRDCTYEQLEVVAPEELARIFGGGG
jgi:ATP-dependent DNA ligase